ncbi:zonadhesin-like isoform X2 [Palaemon carinicauda]|uniref:zonadhesin-like isoform X2 n=1 Tax=Palaemon carinicauda TaxID=392227 RepID=UPI0035B6AA40
MPWKDQKMPFFNMACLLMTNSIISGQLISLEEPVCCFNGTEHRPGSKVYIIEESCVDLVCAIDKSKSPAVAVIINVQKRPEDCKGTPCKDCYDTSCVDQSGIVRLLGDTWMPTKCFACECTAGQVVDCKPVPVACEPRPNPSCVEISGPCCPTWKCSEEYCVDGDGKRREIDEKWGGPCIFHSCSPRGILTSVINCVRPPLLNSSCELFTPKDKCCPVVSCGCVDDKGVQRKLGEVWGGPCTVFTCTTEGVITRIEDCAPIPLLNSSCEIFKPEGKCCPEVRCGCVDDKGVQRKLGEVWGGPCTVFTCTTEGVITRIEDCAPIPLLNSSCEIFKPEGKCCPEVRCGCVDDKGVQRKLGEVWGGPCTVFTCTTEGVITRIEDCAPIPLLNSSCEIFKPEGKCCPDVRCGCVDDQGITRKINETWGSPCSQNTCTPEGIATLIIDCQETPKLNSSCQLVFSEDKCCPEVTCSCVDDNGVTRAINETWGTPCIVNTCTPNGVAVYIKDCARPPVLNETCKLVSKPDECCPVISCGSCIDSNGIKHDAGSTWERGCKSFTCTEGGKIIEALVNCTNSTLGDPEHLNCIVSVVPGKCCPEWVCGIDCALVRCRGPPHIDCVANALLPLQCCATYTCPANSTGCVDASGVTRAVGSRWEKGCTLSECVENGTIVEVPIKCPSINDLESPEHTNCIIGIPPRKCCPQWICGPDCSLLFCAGPPSKTCFADDLPPLQCCPTYTCPQNNSGCIDATGTFRAVGSKWERGCTSFQCVEEGNIIEASITCSSVDAFGSPPHFNCIVGIVPGRCCPEWICGPNCAAVLCAGPPSSNCIANEIPPLKCCATYECPVSPTTTTTTASFFGECNVGTTWIQDCLKHTCTAEGIISKPYQCEINPMPDPGCTLVLPPGKCCPEWQCGYKV